MVTGTASGSHLDLGRAPYVWYGVKYIDLVTLALFSGGHGHRDSDVPPPYSEIDRGHTSTAQHVAAVATVSLFF